jgi:hypothetical protein
MTLRRAIVQGYDTGESTPKGVASAVDVRQSVSALAIREGVFFTAADACEASGTGTMDVELQPFRAAIESPLGGYYLVTEDDVASVTLDPADSSNDRVDLICVIQNDYQVDPIETESEAEYLVVTGTPGLSPTAEPVPSGALALWECEVPANATTSSDGVVFTPRFLWTAPAGARVPVRSVAELPTGSEGLEANVFTTPGAFWRHDGSAWKMFGVPRFVDDTARDAALAAPALGMHCVLTSDEVTYRHNGSEWKAWESGWISFNPTLSNIAVGTGGSAEKEGRYRYVGGQVEAEYKLVLGTSGASVGSTPTATLPVEAEALTHTLMVLDGLGSMFDSSGSDLRVAFMQLTSTTVARFAYFTPSGIGFTIPTSSLPWTWAAGDAIHMTIRYTPA